MVDKSVDKSNESCCRSTKSACSCTEGASIPISASVSAPAFSQNSSQHEQQIQEKQFCIVSLGCRTNQYEAQAYRDQLEALGFKEVTDGAQASICIVNTCTVTAQADKDSRYAIRKLARQYPYAKILVTGCSTEGHVEELEAMDGVYAVVRNGDKEKLLERLFTPEELPEFSIRTFDSHTRAFVKVQDGCNSFCTYCVIPYVRGRSRSRDIPSIVREVEELVQNGYKEVVLTGINVGDFDGNTPKGIPPHRLADLLHAVDILPGIKRLRLSSIDPDEVDDELLGAIIGGVNTCPSMHLVLQSGSNLILKRMNRKYTRQIFLETFFRLREACPDFTATTDIIVGFPGETDHDFAETLQVVEEVQFAKVHIFPYSPRERTRAATYLNQVPQEVVDARKKELGRAAERAAFALRERFVGRVMSVLTEQSFTPGRTVGHTSNFLFVFIEGVELPPNQLVSVELIENHSEGLLGRLYSSSPSSSGAL